ncbi:MAG TPA: hypothetical protein VG099_04925 [Gemmataceae bacterium]|jgi:hypothetical protein|nr:hypothetical protein [Gemmataceae bacterium]
MLRRLCRTIGVTLFVGGLSYMFIGRGIAEPDQTLLKLMIRAGGAGACLGAVLCYLADGKKKPMLSNC